MQILHDSQGISIVEWPDGDWTIVVSHDTPEETATRIWRDTVPVGWDIVDSWMDLEEAQDHYVLRKASQ